MLEDKRGANTRMSDIAKAAGVSRQAVYLHFPNRADLLIATTRYLDEVAKIDEQMAAWENASEGLEKLDRYIEIWGGHVPKVYGVAQALIAMKSTDEEAAAAWEERMSAIRDGCRVIVQTMLKDASLTTHLKEDEATDLLWTLLSISNWEQLTQTCGWSQTAYIEMMKTLTRNALTDPKKAISFDFM